MKVRESRRRDAGSNDLRAVSGPRSRFTHIVLVLWAFAMLVSSTALAHGPTIEISHQEMKPSLLNLFVGTTVHFLNTVDMPGGHVVVDVAGTIESPPLDAAGDDWHFTFETEGTYELFIREHPEAKSRIVVVPRRGVPRPAVPSPDPGTPQKSR